MNSPRIKLLPVWLLAVLMLAGVSQSNAAIALLDTGNKTIIRGGGGSTAFSAAATVSSGAKVLVVMVVNKGAGGGDAYPASLLWQGQTVLKAIGTNNTQGTWRDASIYYLWNPTAASGNITGTFLQSVNDYWVSIYTLTGVDSTVAPLTGSTNATTANSIAFTVNSVPANGWVATCANYANGTGANGFILGVTNAGAASGTVTSNVNLTDTSYNTPMMMSYASGLTAGTTTFTATETYSAGGSVNQKMAFVAAIFTPLKGTPAITTNLTNQTVFSGANATFVVGATSDTTISYGWYTNGVRNPSANTNSYIFSNAKLVDNGRTFQVYLTNSLGVSTSALATLTVMPVAPTGLTATGGTNRVALSWAAADGATNYVIQQSTTNGGPYTRIATNATTSYANTSLSNGTTYYYVVLAQTALGESANSAQASAITVPAAPASLTSLPGNNQVTLNWTASTGAVSYVVKRSLTSGSGYAPITTNGSLSFVDTTAVNLTTYYYVVAARNAAGDSATNSPEASSMPNTSPINVGAVGSSGKITLVWDALTGATSYNIKRGASSGGPYITIASGVTDTFYQNTGLSDGAIFYYVISAQLAGGESANSSEVFASTSILAPTGLTATPVSISEIDLSWTSGGAGATLYKIERSADGLTYTQIATTTGTSYANSNLTVATKYYYRVRASNGVTDSPYSNFAQGITYSLMVAVNFATPAFTNYPGYLEDYGYAYADRGNGYSYGWNVDTSGDARTRLSGVSPDGRYDSLVHLMKGDPANPTNSHTWKIALPNGNYTVHVVGGDPTATDMDMQFLLNGVATAAVDLRPGALGHWVEYTNSVNVTNGLLTVGSGSLAYNNKICYIDIFAPSIAPSILAQPQDMNLLEGFGPTNFLVSALGSAPLSYQWYINTNTPLAGQTNASVVFNPVHASDAGMYDVVVTNNWGAVTSRYASLLVTADLIPPYVVSVTEGIATNTVRVLFSEPVTTVTAANAANYLLNGGLTITNVSMVGNQVAVLSCSTFLTPGTTYTLVSSNVTDQSTAANVLSPNPTTNQFTAWLVVSNGVVRREYFEALDTTGYVTNMLMAAKFTNNQPDSVAYLTSMDTPTAVSTDLGDHGHTNYGARLSGYLIPPVTGNYLFFLFADDEGRFLLSTNEAPAGLQTVVRYPDGGLGANYGLYSSAVRLIAGRMYYMEGLLKQAAAGDGYHVTWQVPGSGVFANIPSSNIAVAVRADYVPVITQQPANVVVNEGQTATFAFGVSSPEKGIAYQWQTNLVNVLNATNGSFVIPIARPSMNGSIRCVATARMETGPQLAGSITNVVTSASATLTVNPDVTAPAVASTWSDATLTNVYLTFNEWVQTASAANPANYTLSGGLSVLSATLKADGSNVVLVTTPQTIGTTYYVTNNGVRDMSDGGNYTANVVSSFQSWVLTRGFLRAELYTNITFTANNLSYLTNNTKFLNNTPDVVSYLPSFWFYATNADGTEMANYGVRVWGYFLAPSNGTYRFYLRSDDASLLYFNPNGTDPAGRAVIAHEDACCAGYIAAPTADPRTSAAYPLVGGQSYYIEALGQQGGGGQYLQVAFREQGDTSTPSSQAGSTRNGTNALPDSHYYTVGAGTNEVAAGAHFAALANPLGVNVNFTQQPLGTTVAEGQAASFTLAVTTSPTNLVFFQWQRNGADVPFANSNFYTTPLQSASGEGDTFTCLVMTPGLTATSAIATLHVMRTPIGVQAQGGTNQISLTWTASPYATNYVVSRSATLAGTYTPITTTTGVSFVDTSLPDGTTFFYALAAQGTPGQTVNSTPVSAVTAPSAPTGLSVLNGDSQVSISWTASSSATGYVVSVSGVLGGPYTPVLTNGATFCNLTGLANGTLYYYVVVAVNGGGFSPPSSEVIGAPNVAPAGLTATGGTNVITLGWSTLSGATTYNIKRSLNSGGPFATIQTGVSGTTYPDTTMAGGTRYYYIVSAQLAGGESANSTSANALSVPSAPVLTATLLNGTNANLGWTSGNDPAQTTYFIERCTDNYSFGSLVSASGATTNYLDQNLFVGVVYYYRIRGTNSTGFGPYSLVANAGTSQGFYSFAKVNFGSGPLGQGGSMTNYPGYLVDIGEVYGLRTNGYTYGWDADNQANARWRLHIDPAVYLGGVYDYRCDTFIHLDKQVPSRVWEMAVPVGMYRVQVVGGDPDNINQSIQYRIEGATTAMHDCTAENVRFVDYSNIVVSVTDGRLTITSGVIATNNKICYVEIDSMGRADLVIGTQPQSQEVFENRPVSFSVVVTNGIAPITYQWFHDGNPIVNATNGAFNIALAQTSDAGGYWVGISNFVGSITSAVATLTVDTDSAPPVVLSVGSLNGSEIGIVFDEPLDPARGDTGPAVSDPTSYTVNGNYPATATLRPDGRTVQLTMAVGDEVSGTFDVEVSYLYDLKGNQMDIASGFGTVLNPLAFHQDIGSGVGTVDPLYAGSAFVGSSADFIEVLAGGSDIGSTNDAAQFVYLKMTNDFAAKVRVDSLGKTDPYAKAGLLARPSLAANAQTLGVFVTPAAASGGAGVYQTLARPAATSNSVVLSQAGLLQPTNWVKLQRTGNALFTFYSADGATWVPFATNTPSPALPSVLYVGLATTAHTNTATDYTLATYAGFESIPPLTITTQPQPASVTLDIRASVTFSNLALVSSLPVTYQWLHNGVALPNATNADLTLTNLATADSGAYLVAIANTIGTVLSAPCLLTVTNGLPILVPNALIATQNVARTFTAASLLTGASDPEGDPLALLAVYGVPVTFTNSFESGLPAGTMTNGVAIVDTTGGVDNSGVLKLTPATGSQSGWFNISNLAPGRLVSAFTASFKVLLTSGSLPPADGFSFNFTPTLPVGTWPPPPFVGAGQEEGLPTGLSVCFDTYNNGATEVPSNGAPAIDIRWNGAQIGHVMMPTYTNADWQPVNITLHPDGTLDVNFDGTNVYQGFPTGFVPMEGGFVLGGRTGGSLETHYVDDLSITAWTSQTPAGGDVRLSAGQVLYTPPTNACGADSFSYVAGDLAGGASIGTATITLECFQISGQVALEGYRGPARNGSGTRPVTFTSTDAGGTPLATWTQSLTFAGGVASYTLANVPAGTANLSAKTAWNLRKRLSATFSAYAATVNFTGANLLPAGDLDNSNLVDILDYYRLAAAWYQPNAAADLDGSGLVDLDDYFLLASRWSELGDPQ